MQRHFPRLEYGRREIQHLIHQGEMASQIFQQKNLDQKRKEEELAFRAWDRQKQELAREEVAKQQGLVDGGTPDNP